MELLAEFTVAIKNLQNCICFSTLLVFSSVTKNCVV